MEKQLRGRMVKRLINRFKIDNSLTPESFDSLLTFLGPDRESAGEAYLDLRRALFIFFAARGVASPGEMADETINRVARRLGEGAQITAENPSSYVYAVARNVWRESLANPNPLISLSENDVPAIIPVTPHDLMINARERIESEAKYECLEKCLDQLNSGERELIIAYYRFNGGEKIENRKRLATDLGLTGNTLRQKVARLKSRLAGCINGCQKSRSQVGLNRGDKYS
jgi:RNA polymerase sigma factor (sigma-70 family)